MGPTRCTEEKQKFNNMYTSCIHAKEPGKRNDSPRWFKPPPSIPSSAKDQKMLGWRVKLLEVTRKSSVNKGMVQTTFSTDKFLKIQQHSPLPDTKREAPLQMEASLVNINVSHKRVTSTQFSELSLYLLFLKKNQTKIITMPNRQV